MALFKIFKGNSLTLPDTYKDGYCYFTIDDGKMYIDTSDATDGSGRVCLNAKIADFSLSAEQANKLSSTHITTSSDLDGFFEKNVFKTATYNNVPVKNIDGHGILLSGGWNGNYGFQLAIDDNQSYKMALRQKSGSNWTDWKLLPMADGQHASGTWDIDISGKANSANYATCSTAAGTAAKVAAIQNNGSFILEPGARVSVKFTYANSAANPTLNVNSTDAKYIRWRNANIPSTQYWSANQVVDFIYDGTYWLMASAINNTTYSVVTSSANGLVPMFDVVDGTIDNSTSDWVLTNNNGSIGWYRLPTNAFNDTTYSIMTGATASVAGAAGLVPAPAPGKQTSFLRGDGTWVVPTNTTYSVVSTSANGLAPRRDGNATSFLCGDGQWKAIPIFIKSGTTAAPGLVPAPPTTAGSTKFLREDGTWVAPSSSTDTKNTAGSTNSSNKLFLIGATSQAANPQTYSHDTAYVGTDGHLYSNRKQVVNLSDTQALTNKTYNGYTLGAACAKSVTDSEFASYIGTSSSLVTERDVYYGLPTINNSHTYTSSTTIYAPTKGGTSGNLLIANGLTSTPTWTNPTNLTVGKANQLTTERTIELTGDVTGSAKFNGSANCSINCSINTTTNQPGYIELFPGSSANHGGYIDFHYNNNSANYTSRIIESSSGILQINGANITNGKVYGAVWNDYAEYRNQIENIKPGYCVASANNGQVYKTTEKFQACDGIVSDTFGFAIGETDECKTPLAVAGRVLAYFHGNREDYNAGDTVCAGPEGKVMKMTREEIKEYPDRIIGIVSEIPTYETWGNKNIKVNNRIWIKIR